MPPLVPDGMVVVLELVVGVVVVVAVDSSLGSVGSAGPEGYP